MSGPLNGQVAVITGANAGIGCSAAELLVGAGASVTMVCRSRERGEAALEEVRQAAEAAGSGGEARLEIADLASQDDARALGGRLRAREAAVDILVNNAGVWVKDLALSPDGFEMTFAINHLGHFLLAHLLLDRLAAGRGRIVNVSSIAHRSGDLRRAPLAEIARGEAWRGGNPAYCDSKLANILFTRESARRWGGRGVTANALHPGVLVTNLLAGHKGLAGWIVRPLKPFMRGPEVGGDGIMALVENPARDEETGRYFKIREEAEPSEQARDESLARELWDRSLEWTAP